MKSHTAYTPNRRQLLASTGIGALLGAALGASFLDAELASDHPTITIYRTPGLFSMLIELASSRLLMLHGDEGAAVSEATHSTTGFLRHRIDIVLASDAILRTLPVSFIERWNVSAVYPLPDRHRPFADPLYGRQLTIGDLVISPESVPFGEWTTTTQTPSQPWYLDIRYGSTRCSYGSSWDVLERITPLPEAGLTMSVSNDENPPPFATTSVDIIAAPAEVSQAVGQSDTAQFGVQLIRLYRHYPISIHLRPQSIVVPDDVQFL